MKYNQWLDIWLENYVKPTSKIKTYTIYKQIVEKRLKPRLGEYDLNEISPVILQCYVTELLRQGNAIAGTGLSANTVNGIITVIQNSLKLACSVTSIGDDVYSFLYRSFYIKTVGREKIAVRLFFMLVFCACFLRPIEKYITKITVPSFASNICIFRKW